MAITSVTITVAIPGATPGTTGTTGTVLLAGQHATVTFDFNEQPANFAPIDVGVHSPSTWGWANSLAGTMQDFVGPSSGSHIVTATFIPIDGVNVPSVEIQLDLAGVDSAVTHQPGSGVFSAHAFAIDTLRPTVSAHLAEADDALGDDVIIQFSEPVSGFTERDLTLSGSNHTLVPGSLQQSPSSPTTWTARLMPGDGHEQSVTGAISVDMSDVTDSNGNAGVGSPSFEIVRPTLAASGHTISDPNVGIGERSNVTIKFSEPVKVLNAGTLDLDYNLVGMSSAMEPVTPDANGFSDAWVFHLTDPAPGTTSTNLPLSVRLGGTHTGPLVPAVIDRTGNPGVGTVPTGLTVSGDAVRPTLLNTSIAYAATESDTTLKFGETATVTFTFSEPLADFNGSRGLEIFNAIANSDPDTYGHLSQPLSTGDGHIWTSTLSSASALGVMTTNNTVRVNLSGVHDLAGNTVSGSTIDTGVSYSIDTLLPTLPSIGIDKTVLKAGDTATVMFNFSEAVTGFTRDDIVVTDANGTLSAPTAVGSDHKTWTATFTPAVNTASAHNKISVDLSGVSDIAGNAGTGSVSSVDYGVSTERPGVGIVLTDTSLAAGATTTVTFNFSEAVTGFTASDIVLTDAHGTLSALTAVGSERKTWTATFTPAVNTENAGNTIHIDRAGVSNDAGNTGEGRASSAPYSVDTKAPVLSSATISGNRLLLAYTEGMGLDAAHKAAPDAFTVLVNGAADRVSAVDVDAAANTVSLTLAQAVTGGETVTVAYADPTLGNDQNAVQDAAGNDAAGLTLDAVNSPAPAPPLASPAPPTGPSPVPSPVPPTVSQPRDADHDGLPDILENQTPGLPGPNGAAPMAGDGNGDGIRDSAQTDVNSIRVRLSPTGASHPADAPSSFMTLVQGGQDGKPDTGGSNAHLNSLGQKDAPASLPQGLEMPIGLLRFEAVLATGGPGSENFSLYLNPALGVNGQWVQAQDSGMWVNLASAPYGGKMQIEGGQLRLDFQVTDGGPFDADGKADGVITIPGAPAHMPLSIVGQAPDAGPGGLLGLMELWF